MEKFELLYRISEVKRKGVIRLYKKAEKKCFKKKKCSSRNIDVDLFKQKCCLNNMIYVNRSFLIESLIRKTTDPLVAILKQDMYSRLFLDEKFLEFLISESLTNRLCKACQLKEVPDWLVEKIEVCALAFILCE